jgi:diaminohydroxyphosphoribosylaminopyrimidine deaminase/5-amino-6-(5-phosphoribosylamino)uracil reductase
MSRPHVTLKLATSLDGRIATAAGESRWITSEVARAEVHKLRAASDTVLIGAGTARADDPELTARASPGPDLAPARQPLRVVITSNFDLAPQGRLFAATTVSPLLIIGRTDAPEAARAALIAAGAGTAAVAPSGEGVDLAAALAMLAAEWSVARVLAEGGGGLAGALIAADLIDRIEWFRAPMVLGAAGIPAIGALALAQLADAPRFKRVALRELGPDLCESYQRV